MCRGALVLVALLVFGGMAVRAEGAVDLSGSWTVYYESRPTETWDVVQNGVTLTVTVNGSERSGTIDADSGDFRVTWSTGVGPCPSAIVATASADSNVFGGDAFNGVFICGPHCPNPCFLERAGAVRACRNGASGDCCGDALVGPTEECDNGPEPETSCCDPTCHFASSGSSCAADGNPCTDDVCDGAGTCGHPLTPAGTPCPDDTQACTDDLCDGAGTCTHPGRPDSDGDGVCDAIDVCTNGVPLERAVVKLRKFTTPGGDDRLLVRGELTLPVPFDPPLDPIENGIRLVVEDALGSTLVDALLPSGLSSDTGTTGWRANGAGTIFVFRTLFPVGDAVRSARIALLGDDPGHVKLSIKGSRGSYAFLPVATPVTVSVALDPPAATTGQCAEITFPASACTPAASGTVSCKD